ncbi:hypothetical protein LCGC14_0409250 [marine sediment metagenome]|uniref:Type II secretion system protein GspI C-terminal domain-containing protein n=1 Tax=marine sediment metagenome TaxID=412755 RepID=A0A0F9SUE8_9ZZZZ|nr:hypothetical protein [Phycisphaerae bacterium]HDZ44311.1 hypothetical protein [Phycisphaerae bacterium]
MKTVSTRYGKGCSGATLVEALAGTALLGLVLATLVTAAGQMKRQAYFADARTEACDVADELLTQWWADRDHFPRDQTGIVGDQSRWAWRTHRVGTVTIGSVTGEIIAVEVLDRQAPEPEVAVYIEIVLPAPDDE